MSTSPPDPRQADRRARRASPPVAGGLQFAAQLAMLALLWPWAAKAQGDPPSPPGASAPAADLAPPKLTFDPGVAYPAQALRERVFDTRTVTLVLDIDASGAVTRATVETRQGHGFDEVATAAANRLVFQPASRGGRAIGSKIKCTRSANGHGPAAHPERTPRR